MKSSDNEASILALLHEAYPAHAAKRIAQAADVPLGTAKAWASGRFTPPSSILLKMADRCELIADALERRLHARRRDRMAGEVAPPLRALAAGEG
jgi:hypothetical protein